MSIDSVEENNVGSNSNEDEYIRNTLSCDCSSRSTQSENSNECANECAGVVQCGLDENIRSSCEMSLNEPRKGIMSSKTCKSDIISKASMSTSPRNSQTVDDSKVSVIIAKEDHSEFVQAQDNASKELIAQEGVFPSNLCMGCVCRTSKLHVEHEIETTSTNAENEKASFLPILPDLSSSKFRVETVPNTDPNTHPTSSSDVQNTDPKPPTIENENEHDLNLKHTKKIKKSCNTSPKVNRKRKMSMHSEIFTGIMQNESEAKSNENQVTSKFFLKEEISYPQMTKFNSRKQKDKEMREVKSFDDLSRLLEPPVKRIKANQNAFLPMLSSNAQPNLMDVPAQIYENNTNLDNIHTPRNLNDQFESNTPSKQEFVVEGYSGILHAGAGYINQRTSQVVLKSARRKDRMRSINDLRRKYAIVIGRMRNEKLNSNMDHQNPNSQNLSSQAWKEELQNPEKCENSSIEHMNRPPSKMKSKKIRDKVSKSYNRKFDRSRTKSPTRKRPFPPDSTPLYKMPIEFFTSSAPKLLIQNFEETLHTAKVNQAKLPLTLIFNQRRQSVGMVDIPSFSSDFENGNLQQVWRDANGEYFLFLHSDRGSFNCLWFHFFIGNLKQGCTYTINICNIANKAHNWNRGFQPCMKVGVEESSFWRCAFNDNAYAQECAEHGFSGWKKFGENCIYFKTQSPELKKRARILLGQHKLQRTRTLYTFRFQFTVDKQLENEINSCAKDAGLFIAFSYPYTYSDLCRSILKLSRSVNRSNVKFSIDTLCNSVFGRDVKLISITSSSFSIKKGKKKAKIQEPGIIAEEDNEVSIRRASKKPVIFITCRAHPGESCGSHVLSGIIDFLALSSDRIAKMLRANFQFKIVPMLNPDGVIGGYQRSAPTTSTKSGDEGVNLNEIYDSAEKKSHPTVFATKRLVQKLASTRSVALFLDLHGHYNSNYAAHFLYGYTDESNLGDATQDIYRFAKCLEEECAKYPNGQTIFLNKDELIRSNNYKKPGVAPVFFSSQYGINNAYTVESCMHTSSEYQFSPKDYYNYGRALCMAMYNTFAYLCEK